MTRTDPMGHDVSATTTTPPADGHVHSEWSWDAPDGNMLDSCRRAAALDLPAVAFTEHVDHTVWAVDPAALLPDDHLALVADDAGTIRPPPFEVGGYLRTIERCRERFPGLRILTGVELGEPHRHRAQVRDVLDRATFDRVLGSVHSLRATDRTYTEPPGLYRDRPAGSVLADYLEEVTVLAESSADFEVLAHVDYAVRTWPGGPDNCDLEGHADRFRGALRALARSGRALEVNTRLPTAGRILAWWHGVGGRAIAFGSDAHSPDAVGRDLVRAARAAGVAGFAPGRHPYDLWRRV